MSLGFQAAIFDMDGVITQTAGLHAAAWKELFDDLLRRQAANGSTYEPFDERSEYRSYVDGKPRREGVRGFLRARRITLSEEEEEELARRKDELFERRLHEQGVQTFASTIALIRALRERGTKTGVVTSSRHGREILQAAGIASLFDVRLDGIDLAELGLKGKPDPDMFLRAAQSLGAGPGRSLVFEDAVAGVQAGRRGGFGLVVGVDRGGAAQALAAAGADLVVQDLAELRSRPPRSGLLRTPAGNRMACRAGRLRPRARAADGKPVCRGQRLSRRARRAGHTPAGLAVRPVHRGHLRPQAPRPALLGNRVPCRRA